MKNILLVDDNPNMIKLISYFLKNNNLNIYSASNGKEALEKIKDIHMDFIFLDLMMPELDGFSVAHALKENHIKTPTVVLTSKEVTSEEHNYLTNLGIKRCLNKEKINQELISNLIKEFVGA